MSCFIRILQSILCRKDDHPDDNANEISHFNTSLYTRLASSPGSSNSERSCITSPQASYSSHSPSASLPELATSCSRPSLSSLKPAASSTKPYASSSPNPTPSFKPIVSSALPSSNEQQTKANNVWTGKDESSIGAVLFARKVLIKTSKVPEVLKNPFPAQSSTSSEFSVSNSMPSQASTSLKPTVSSAMPSATKYQTKANDVSTKKDESSICAVPNTMETFIKKDKQPEALKNPFSPPTPTSSKPFTPNLGPPQASATFRPTESPTMTKSSRQQTNDKYIWIEKEKTPKSAVPKSCEDYIKKDMLPKALKNPSSRQAFPSSDQSILNSRPPQPLDSSKPTVSPYMLNSSKQQTNANSVWIEKDKSPICTKPKDLTKKDMLHEALKNTSSPRASKSSEPSTLNSLPSFKPTLSPASPNLNVQREKASYVWIQKDKSPIYAIPKAIEDLIKKDQVPEVLKNLLLPSTYKDYFAALLYAEDFYIEKWNEFQLENVSLKLDVAAINKKSSKDTISHKSYEKEYKTFVAFEIEKAPERRPFLLSRDFVFAKPLGKKRTEPFKGIIYRVKNSTLLLVEFGEDFHSQHQSTTKYDVSFSFNRVCLKRAHQAIAAASDPLFRSFIFPDCVSRKGTPISSPVHWCSHKLDKVQKSAVTNILSSRGAPPYLVEGPLCGTSANMNASDSRTGLVVQEAVFQIYRSSSKHRILICAPINNTCDVLTRYLKTEIPESDIFRANAAFRELEEVPFDILTSCSFEGECFTCPPLEELKEFRVIFSTFVSSFRLHNEGITAGHFSHIFLIDASSATEPEVMIALANLASKNTTVIVTGEPGNRSTVVRSDIARMHGLRISYFERLCASKPYSGLDPMFITNLDPLETEYDTDSWFSYSNV